MLSSAVITELSPQLPIANATVGANAQIPPIDDAGSISLPDNQAARALGIHVYSTTSSIDTASQVLSPIAGYVGCYFANSTATACNPVVLPKPQM